MFREQEFLCRGHIGLHERWTLQSISPRIAVGSGQWLYESIGIKVLIRSALDHRAGEGWIDGRAHGIARVAVIGWVVGKLRGKRQAGLLCFDGADVPVSEEPSYPWTAIGVLAAAERNIIRGGQHARMAHVN